MTCQRNCIGEDNLQLIDFLEEDDYLIDFPFRDSLEDFRISVSCDNAIEHDRNKRFEGVNPKVEEQSNCVQSESMEPRRPSFLRKSLAWDSAFFNSAGVLNPEELFLINKGFIKDEPSRSSIVTKTYGRPPKRAGQDTTSPDDHLEALEGDPFEDMKPNLDKLSKRFNFATNICRPEVLDQTNAPSCKKTNSLSQNKVKSSLQAPKSQRLNLKGTKGMTNTRNKDPETIQDKVSSRPKLGSRLTNKAVIEGSEKVKMGSKTRKAGLAPDQTVSKRSRWGDSFGFPKSNSFTSPSEKCSKAHRSYESSSSASSSSKHSSKFIRRKISPRNMKPITPPSSLQYPSSYTCSSSTSLSSTDECLPESTSPTSIMHQNSAIAFHNVLLASAFQSPSHAPQQNIEERKLTSEYTTRTSIGTLPFSGGPKRKIKSSGLRMPSPKIGFFDEKQPLQSILKGRTQVCFAGQSPLPNGNIENKFQPCHLSPSVSTENCSKDVEHDGIDASCSKSKLDGQIPKERSRNRMNIGQKMQKDDGSSFPSETMIDMKKKKDERGQCAIKDNERENVCDFEDQVNGLSKYFEIIDLDSDVVIEIKSQQSCIKKKVHEPLDASQLSFPAISEHSTPCLRTPLAENSIEKQ